MRRKNRRNVRIGELKVTSIRINPEIWQKFKKLALEKHNYAYGAISYELEEALRNWIAAHNIAQKQSINPNSRVYQVWEQVRKVLKDWGYFHQTSLPILRKAISIVRGADERTVKKWLKAFKESKVIKEVSPQIYEII